MRARWSISSVFLMGKSMAEAIINMTCPGALTEVITTSPNPTTKLTNTGTSTTATPSEATATAATMLAKITTTDPSATTTPIEPTATAATMLTKTTTTKSSLTAPTYETIAWNNVAGRSYAPSAALVVVLCSVLRA